MEVSIFFHAMWGQPTVVVALSDLRGGSVYVPEMATDTNLTGRKDGKATFRRTRFLASVLLSAPAVVFAYSPLLVALTVAGIAVPFATGRFIDAIVGGTPPVAPFIALAALPLARATATPCLQRLILSCARRIELKLQERTLNAVMDLSPAELSALANEDVVAKLTRDAYAVGGFVSGLYPRLLAAVVTMVSAGIALHARAATLSLAIVAFMPITIVLFLPFARRFAANSHAVRQRSDDSFSTLFSFFFTLPFLQTLHAGPRFADEPQTSLAALKDGNSRMDSLTVSFGALLGALLIGGEVAVLGLAGTLAVRGVIPVATWSSTKCSFSRRCSPCRASSRCSPRRQRFAKESIRWTSSSRAVRRVAAERRSARSQASRSAT